jgi:c-di-GMP-binding flagellar brake protein YcgR
MVPGKEREMSLGYEFVERREFFRVEGRVRLHYRKIRSDSQELEPNDQLGQVSQAKSEDVERESLPLDQMPAEALLREILKRIMAMEEKLDALWHFFSTRWPAEELQLVPALVNISGCGMRFPTKEKFQVGDKLEVTLELPMSPGHLIRLCGEVVHILEPDGRGPYQTAIKFMSVSESDRERIVRYTLDRQYQEICSKRPLVSTS